MNFNLLASIGFVCLFFACNTNNNQKNPVIVELTSKKNTDSSRPNETGAAYNYDLKTPGHTWRLPDQLVEVSGNTWIDKDHLILIEDLHPNLYLVKIDD